MASGSQAQFIKIMTLGGTQVSQIRYVFLYRICLAVASMKTYFCHVRYYDGFLGQRIGPVASLAFHPYQMMMAAAATDNVLSVYTTLES